MARESGPITDELRAEKLINILDRVPVGIGLFDDDGCVAECVLAFGTCSLQLVPAAWTIRTHHMLLRHASHLQVRSGKTTATTLHSSSLRPT